MASKLIQTHLIKSTLSKHTVGLYPCFTQIRWRKPRWLPRAPTKEFYVREPTPIDPVEHAELQWRYTEYRRTVDAIRQHLAEDMKEKQNIRNAMKVDKESEFDTCVQLTEEWNREVAALREKRQAEEDAIELEKQNNLEAERAAHLLKIMTEAEQKLAYEKEQMFITMENMDEEIDKVLDVQIDYEYAIDSKGYRYTYKGKELLPTKDNKSLANS